MKKKTKIILAIAAGIPACFLIVMTLYLVIMYEPDLEASFETGNPESDARVLIASSGSSFKQELIREIAAALQDSRIRVIPLGELEKVQPGEYNGILVMTSCEMYKIDSDAAGFLEKHAPGDNLALLITSGNGEWNTDKYGIDTVTGASEPEQKDRLIREAVARLKSFLE